MIKRIAINKSKNKERFVGLHFDFHADSLCKNIGYPLAAKTLKHLLNVVKPDFVQCDCKGIRGLTSYPTKVGYTAPGLKKDTLKLWRNVTNKKEILLFVHYCGLWDEAVITHHPSWARVDSEGKRDKRRVSIFSPYLKKILIPQLTEIIDTYKVDGVWIDADSWVCEHDYGIRAKNAFLKETGLKKIPSEDSPDFSLFTEFNRQRYREYLNYFCEAMHSHKSDFKVAINWAYTSWMPEKPGNVDFVSGDYTPQNSVNIARFESRCIASQGKPWDLMTWCFKSPFKMTAYSTKSVPQLQQEAAVIISQGGGFQMYFYQKSDAAIIEWQIKLMKDVIRFCRKYQQFCQKTESIPQIGLLHSSANYYHNNKRLFSPYEPIDSPPVRMPVAEILNMLLDSQYSVDVVMEHTIKGCMTQYPLLVLPEVNFLTADFREELLNYVKNGGRLLLIGAETTNLFKDELGIKCIGRPQKKNIWLAANNWLAGLNTMIQQVTLGKTTQGLSIALNENDFSAEGMPLAFSNRLGKGTIAAICADMSQSYLTNATATQRMFLNQVVRKIFARPIVEVTGSSNVDVIAKKCDNNLILIHLVNTAGQHGNPNVCTYDEIPPVGPLNIKIRVSRKPKNVMLASSCAAVEYTYQTGQVHLQIPNLQMYEIIVIELTNFQND